MGLLRFILAISVVTAHCGSLFGKISFVGGDIAVQTFFIISGFYMSLVLDKKYQASNNIENYKLFITNRLLRLYPIYWIILIISVLFLLTTESLEIASYKMLNFTSLIYLLFTNIFIFFQDVVMFLGVDLNNGNLFFTSNFNITSPKLYKFLFIPQGWSLGIELLFYLIAPFIIKRNNTFIFVLAILSISMRFILFNFLNLNHDPWTYRFFPTELFFFLIGIISHRYSSNIIKLPINPILLLFVIIFITCIFSDIPSIHISFLPFNIKSILYFTLISISIPKLFNSFKGLKIDRQIGELSYPLYISHMLVYSVTRLYIFNGFNSGTFVIIFSTLLSVFLVKYISNPIEKFRQARVNISTASKPTYQNSN